MLREFEDGLQQDFVIILHLLEALVEGLLVGERPDLPLLPAQLRVVLVVLLMG